MIDWTKELDVELDRLADEMDTRWSEIERLFSRRTTKEDLRSRWRSPEHRRNIREHYVSLSGDMEIESINRSQEIMADGSIRTEGQIVLDGDRRDDLIGDRELLIAHKFDPDRLELVRAKSSNWQVIMDDEGTRVVKTLFQSSVTVKPLKEFVDWEFINNQLRDVVPAITINPNRSKELRHKSERNLVIHLTDLHFGNATQGDYAEYFQEMYDQLGLGYKNVVIACTGDLLNEDNYDGTTRRGTQIGQTDMTQAWLDAFDMLSNLIATACERTEGDVQFMYVGGNHDWFSGHTVMLALIRAFEGTPNLRFDWSKDTFKATMMDDVMVAVAHGDLRNLKDYAGIFASRFPKAWGKAKIRECFVGHLHHAESFKKYDGGMMIRRSPTRNPEDDYHNHHGYDREGKMFLMYEYTKNQYKGELAI